MPIVYDSLARASYGGTEYMMHELEKRLEKNLLDKFYIARCIDTITKLPNDKIKIFWAHQFPLPNFHNEPVWFQEKKWEGFDKIVFVSNTQQNLFVNFYKMDYCDFNNFKVIPNAINPELNISKPTNTINLIYISSPDRGLEILYNTFSMLSEKYKNVFLRVFSSTSVKKEAKEKFLSETPFTALYKKLQSHPKIFFSERVPHIKVLEELAKSHIFVYPSTWWETFCISLAEAMSAKCICVHPNFGALYETSGGLTNMYDWVCDKETHVQVLYKHLEEAIQQVIAGKFSNLDFNKQFVDKKYNWELITDKWSNYLISLNNNNLYKGEYV